MADDTLYLDMSLLSGINTVDAETDLQPVGTEDGATILPLRAAENIVISNARKPETRIGYKRILVGDSTHSLWSNGDICLFVEGDTLYMLNDDYSITALRKGLMVGARMTYKQWANRIYYSNKHQIGWISTEDYLEHSLRNVGDAESEGTPQTKKTNVFPDVAAIIVSGDVQ